jgi:hypothetical protein
VEGSGSDLIYGTIPAFCLEGLRKTSKTLSRDSLSIGCDLNLGPHEYEEGLLTTQPHLVF